MGKKRYAPSVKHIVAPKIQHHVTDAGPPRVRGVLKVVAILEQRPMMLNAKLICGDVRNRQGCGGGDVRTVAMLENSRLKEGT